MNADPSVSTCEIEQTQWRKQRQTAEEEKNVESCCTANGVGHVKLSGIIRLWQPHYQRNASHKNNIHSGLRNGKNAEKHFIQSKRIAVI